MPILNLPLDPNGHAVVDLVLFPAQPRRQALQVAGQKSLGYSISGMLDTGATVTIIDPQVRQALNLTPFRVRRATVPNSPAPIRTPSYKIDLIILINGVPYFLGPMLSVLEMPLSHTGVSVLVGCDVLSKCQFTHNGSGNVFTLAF